MKWRVWPSAAPKRNRARQDCRAGARPSPKTERSVPGAVTAARRRQLRSWRRSRGLTWRLCGRFRTSWNSVRRPARYPNAVLATSELGLLAPVRLWLLSDKRSVLILVWDSSPQPPARIDAAGDAENGRGLLLVEAISTRWNWYVPHHLGGKVIWAQIGAEPR